MHTLFWVHERARKAFACKFVEPCVWVVEVADEQTCIILVIFWSVYPLIPWKIEKWNFQKILKKSLDNLILNICTKYYDH